MLWGYRTPVAKNDSCALLLLLYILSLSMASSCPRSASLSCLRGNWMSKRSRRLPLAPVLLLGMPA